MEVIIHKNEENRISVTYRANPSMSMIELGYYVVPYGVKFKILDFSLIEPYINSDFFEAMEYDFDNDFDGVGMSDSEWNEYLQTK
jgi:hypothetical protein